jgi:hypothetical protein
MAALTSGGTLTLTYPLDLSAIEARVVYAAPSHFRGGLVYAALSHFVVVVTWSTTASLSASMAALTSGCFTPPGPSNEPRACTSTRRGHDARMIAGS